MGNPKGVRRDFEALERRRLQAVALLKQGLNESEVARRLKVSHTSVNRWARVLAQQGSRGLKQAGRAGRKPRLGAEDLKRLEQGLLKGPGALGYENAAVDLVAGGPFDRTGVWRPLPQRARVEDSAPVEMELPAVGRARERNEQAIQHWKKVEGPRIKKKPKKRGAPSSSSTRAG